MENKKVTGRIVAVLLIALGLVLGVTWTPSRYCIGDEIFTAPGISPWSNGTTGAHYPAILGSFTLLAGISLLNLTLQKKSRFWLWTTVVLLLIVLNWYLTYR